MRRVLTLIFSLLIMSLFQNCADSAKLKAAIDNLDDDTVTDLLDDVRDPTNPPTVITHDPNNCPRYSLYVRSEDSVIASSDYLFEFNGEMTHTAAEGDIYVNFLRDSNTKPLISCSRQYTNVRFHTTILPLQLAEDMTHDMVIRHGVECLPDQRTTYMRVVDNATNDILFDEKPLVDQYGCLFGYRGTGQVLREQILQLSDDITADMASNCN